MLRKLKNIVKQAIITLILDDTDIVQKAQVSFFSNVRNIEILNNYGFWAIAPLGSKVTMFQVGANEENLAGIADDINNRPKNLKEGEVIVKNIKTGSYAYFKEDGSINISGADDLNINLIGDCNITATGNCNIISDNANITATLTTITGNLNVTGSILGSTLEATTTVTAGSNLIGSDAIINGKNVDAHIHGGVTAGASNTSPF